MPAAVATGVWNVSHGTGVSGRWVAGRQLTDDSFSLPVGGARRPWSCAVVSGMMAATVLRRSVELARSTMSAALAQA